MASFEMELRDLREIDEDDKDLALEDLENLKEKVFEVCEMLNDMIGRYGSEEG